MFKRVKRWIRSKIEIIKQLLKLGVPMKKIHFMNDLAFSHLIPFYNYNRQDIKFYESITREFSDVIVCSYINDIDDVYRKFGKLDFVVSMRYHGKENNSLIDYEDIDEKFSDIVKEKRVMTLIQI